MEASVKESPPLDTQSDPDRPRSVFGPFSLSASARYWVALAFILPISVFAFVQSPRPDALRGPQRSDWLIYPLEVNAARRLPKVECSLRAIHPVPNTNSVWAVGNKGMVVNSTDGGSTWLKRGIGAQQLLSPYYPKPSPPAAAARLSFPQWFDLVPVARAEQTPDPKEQRTPPRERQVQPTPTPPYPVRPSGSPRPIGTPTPQRVPTPSAATKAGPSPAVTPGSSPASVDIGQYSAAPSRNPEQENLIGVYFYDEQRGEAVSSSGERFYTANAGENWYTDFVSPVFAVSGNQLLPLRTVIIPPAASLTREYIAVNARNTLFTFKGDDPYTFTFTHDAYSILNFSLLSDRQSGWLTTDNGLVYRTQDGGASWEKLFAPDDTALFGIFFTDKNRGWVTGSAGTIFATSDGGVTWTRQETNTKSLLNAVAFHPDGQRGWVAGNDGVILSTNDGGETWVHRTQGSLAISGIYLRFPAPWYYLTVALLAVVLLRRPKEETSGPAEESVADVLVSDRPLEESSSDVLAFNAIARGLSRFLRNENTLPPLTIAVIGEWGTGKSSLMNLLRADLRSYKFRPVWFNAWHHQKEEHMLASLLQNIKLQAVPRWWTSRGIAFRAHLLWIRGVRHWGPVLLLLFFIYVMAVYHFVHQGSETSLTAFIKTLVNPFVELPGAAAGKTVITLVPLLAGILTFVGAVWRGITAFGVKPASLLAGVSKGANIRGLEAQTSFRQKFSVEFNDVTRALGKRSLLIFIDDLDRCRPENVLETLEAVNFLTTSGECFVVIGMAREYVERCVGRAFNEVAQEMVDDLEAGGKESAEEVAKQKRIEFARQYLDKLVNIEVPVPAPKQAQSLALLVASTREAAVETPAGRWSQFRLAVWNFFADRWRVVVAAIAVVALGFLGYRMANTLASLEAPVLPAATAQASPSPAPSPEPAPSPSPSPRAIATAPASPAPTIEPAGPAENPNLVAGKRAYFSPGIFPLLALIILAWLGHSLLTRRSGLVVKDSPRFISALEIWHPLVFARQCTPRATKRFMNFVRYLAMRQRPQRQTEAPLSRWGTWLKARLIGREIKEEQGVAEADVRQIPDDVLVALAALQQVNHECLREQPGPAGSPDMVWPRAISANSPLRPLFEQARKEHIAKFGNWSELSQYRERFLEMTANVRVR